jgi:SHS2 domain-containing protein
MPYELIDHTADMGMLVRSPTLEGLFEDAAYGLADTMGGRSLQGDEEVAVRCKGIDPADLLVRWLQEVLYLIEVRGLRLRSATMKQLGRTEAHGVVKGAYTGSPLTTEIKAVTYHNLDITHVGNVFMASIILDR